MKQDERDYLLKIINLQESAMQAYTTHNMSKFLGIQKELERMQKSSFREHMDGEKERKKQVLKRIENVFTEFQALVKEL